MGELSAIRTFGRRRPVLSELPVTRQLHAVVHPVRNLYRDHMAWLRARLRYLARWSTGEEFGVESGRGVGIHTLPEGTIPDDAPGIGD